MKVETLGLWTAGRSPIS